ncbi:hypothetical protein [Pontibacter russatus]|uniref:hypothetical protein n=1 Tax=Pontibacter russatus TaxID=2694929 RepID=UPI00137A2822|nr:hypothetical protein [Pontibacter russatus]
MKQLSPLLLLLLLLPAFSFAQTNYKPGLVVTAAGDTLHGFIDYQEWAQTPEAISFRASESSGTEEAFTAGNSRYFEVTGMEAYRSYVGPVSTNRIDRNKLPGNSADASSTVTDTVYLKILQDGVNVALYTHRDDIKQRFFIAKKGVDAPAELIYRRFYQSGNRSKIVSHNGYAGQLLSLAREYDKLTPLLERQIKSAVYNEQPLLELVSKLNGLGDEEIAQELKNRHLTGFFIGVALNRSSLLIEGKDDLADADSNPASYMPRLTFGFDAFLNRNVQRTVLRLEAGVTNASYHVQEVKRRIGIKNGYHEISYRLAYQTVSLTPQVIYSLYNRDNLKFYVGGGMALNFSNYTKNFYREQYFNPHLDLVQEPDEKDDYRELETKSSSYMLRAGVVLNNKFEFSAAYQGPSVFTRYTNFSYSASSVNVGVNYLFRD